MISLQAKTEPYDLDLPYGISVTVTPLTTSGMLAAQAAARRMAEKEYPEDADTQTRDGIYLYPVGERFYQEFTLRQVLLNAAKNGSGASANGISSAAEVPNTAQDAAN